MRPVRWPRFGTPCSFNSRTPGGVRHGQKQTICVTPRFNSRTPGGVRHQLLQTYRSFEEFQFTHPGRGATRHRTKDYARIMFQFTHPGRGATKPELLDGDKERVSIHAPREGCDSPIHPGTTMRCSFNSRTPGGVRHRRRAGQARGSQFQFTHPGRGATEAHRQADAFRQFQFTHPGRGATLLGSISGFRLCVSIHAPREGCDLMVETHQDRPLSFNSRTPGGVRLDEAREGVIAHRVSIHAPREGCDGRDPRHITATTRFNSRTPGGVRLVACSLYLPVGRFNSRTPGGVRQCGAKLRIMGRINKRNLRLEVLL